MEFEKGNRKTVTVADYIHRADYEDLPGEVIKQAKIVILDTIGVMIAASRQRAGKLATEFIQHAGERPESTVVGYDIKAPSISAAFSNAIMAHDIELDDSHGASLTHPAAVIIPTALAMGEKENCAGKDLIIATTVAYDVECRISMALDPQRQYARNFHPSCVCGCFGAAIMKPDAPMTGGIHCPPTEAATSIPAACSGVNPTFFMSGMVKLPVVTVFAVALPLTEPNNPLDITAIKAGPLFMFFVNKQARYMKIFTEPVLNKSSPKRTKRNTKETITPNGIPQIPCWPTAKLSAILHHGYPP